MEAMFWIAGIAVVLLYLSSKAQSGTKTEPPAAKRTAEKPRQQKKPPLILRQLEELQTYWDRIAEAHGQGQASEIVREWWFDPPTDRQIAALNDSDIPVKTEGLTKGQMSDLIGLREPAEPRDEAVLAFFRADKIHRSCQTLARIKAQELLAAPDNAKAWEDRPARPETKEKARLLGLPVPKAAAEETLLRAIYSHLETLDEDDPAHTAVEIFDDAWDLANDPDTREDLDMKKPSVKKVREAVQRALDETAPAAFVDNPPSGDEILEAVLEQDPSLSR